MQTFPPHFIATLAAALALTAAPAHAGLDAAGAARLADLQRTPELAGELIYRGRVADRTEAAGPALFTYERRVARSDDCLASAHITRDPQGTVIIAEEAQFTPDYTLKRFDAANRQAGFSGSVRVSDDGRSLEYRLVEDGVVSTAHERVSAPVVSGPSLHGFILRNWQRLTRGETLPVRLIVLAKKQTYGFDLRLAGQADGRTTFSLTPTNWLVRLALAPLAVTFDDATRTVVRYEGRVPPLRDDQGRLKAFDARVDYANVTPAYR